MNNDLKQQMHQSSGAWLLPRSRNQQAKPREGIGTSSQLPGQVKDSSSDEKIHLLHKYDVTKPLTGSHGKTVHL